MLSIIVQDFRDALALLILFGFTIFVHELGHYLVARWCGMVIDVFSIGFGPALWKKTIGGTEYKIGAIPCGGYVALPQLDPAGMSSVQGGADDGQEKPRQLPPISAWKKILVAFSGALGNIVFAFLLAWGVHAGNSPLERGAMVGVVDTNSLVYARGVRTGDQILAVNGEEVTSWYEYNLECILGAGASNAVLTVKTDDTTRQVVLPASEIDKDMHGIAGLWQDMPPLFGKVATNTPAEEAGLKKLDIVRTYDGVAISGWEQFRDLVEERGEGEFEITVERGGEAVTRTVRPRYSKEAKRSVIGVTVGYLPPWMQKGKPWDQVKADALGIVRILRALLTPRQAKQAAGALGGPVAIIVMLWGSIKISYIYALGFLRFLNINLAILNLLPIPVLDGGHILFALWEGITRRKVPARIVAFLINIFVVLLIGALLILTGRDILRFVPWGKKASSQDDEIQQTHEMAVVAGTNMPTATNALPDATGAEQQDSQ
jgi:regulator of sigma E protease